ncbi:MAG: hypothetical protein ACJ75J_05585, partial [Cytophagaceae bacterium]
MRSKLLLLLSFAIGICSCKKYSSSEEAIIASAEKKMAEMTRYRNENTENLLGYMKENVDGNGRKPKDVAFLNKAGKIKDVSEQILFLLDNPQANSDTLRVKIKLLSADLKTTEEKVQISLPDLNSDPTEINRTTWKLQILNSKNILVNNLAQEISICEPEYIDVVSIVVSEESKVVEEGSTYSAEVYPASGFSAFNYHYKISFEDTNMIFDAAQAKIKYRPKTLNS